MDWRNVLACAHLKAKWWYRYLNLYMSKSPSFYTTLPSSKTFPCSLSLHSCLPLWYKMMLYLVLTTFAISHWFWVILTANFNFLPLKYATIGRLLAHHFRVMGVEWGFPPFDLSRSSGLRLWPIGDAGLLEKLPSVSAATNKQYWCLSVLPRPSLPLYFCLPCGTLVWGGVICWLGGGTCWLVIAECVGGRDIASMS